MRFSINPSGKTYDFVPIYSKQDQCFLTEPDAISDFAIMIKGAYTSQDVSLTTTTAYCISGFNPQWKWIHTKLSFPAAIKGSLHVVFDGVAIPGTGMDYATHREP